MAKTFVQKQADIDNWKRQLLTGWKMKNKREFW